jgi:ADP-L-glycero-D-manno-heptose 6-epimerase
MAILITGAAGFIGSALVSYLNSLKKTNIIVVDRWGKDEKWKNLRALSFDHFIPADELFTDHKARLSQVETVIHLGACSATTETDMDYLWRNNVVYSQKLFRLAVQQECPFLYASSAATYGSGSNGYSDHHQGVPFLRPLNAYGQSKQFFDDWVLRQKRFPKKWFGLKFFNVYGANEYHKGAMVSVPYQAFHQVMSSGKIKLFQSHRLDLCTHGEQKRDFIYVKDVAKMMWAILQQKERGISGIYNCGTGIARSFNDLAVAVFKAMGKEKQIEYIETPLHLQAQYQYFTQAEMGKWKKVFPHWRATSLEQGIDDYVKNFLMKKEDPYFSSRFE